MISSLQTWFLNEMNNFYDSDFKLTDKYHKERLFFYMQNFIASIRETCIKVTIISKSLFCVMFECLYWVQFPRQDSHTQTVIVQDFLQTWLYKKKGQGVPKLSNDLGEGGCLDLCYAGYFFILRRRKVGNCTNQYRYCIQFQNLLQI